MGQDVHKIEMKNKSMQIASQNQKNLFNEIDKLMVFFLVHVIYFI